MKIVVADDEGTGYFYASEAASKLNLDADFRADVRLAPPDTEVRITDESDVSRFIQAVSDIKEHLLVLLDLRLNRDAEVTWSITDKFTREYEALGGLHRVPRLAWDGLAIALVIAAQIEDRNILFRICSSVGDAGTTVDFLEAILRGKGLSHARVTCGNRSLQTLRGAELALTEGLKDFGLLFPGISLSESDSYRELEPLVKALDEHTGCVPDGSTKTNWEHAWLDSALYPGVKRLSELFELSSDQTSSAKALMQCGSPGKGIYSERLWHPPEKAMQFTELGKVLRKLGIPTACLPRGNSLLPVMPGLPFLASLGRFLAQLGSDGASAIQIRWRSDRTTERIEIQLSPLRVRDERELPVPPYGLRDTYLRKRSAKNLSGVSLAFHDLLYGRIGGLDGVSRVACLFRGEGLEDQIVNDEFPEPYEIHLTWTK